jgi:hypothetical protein
MAKAREAVPSFRDRNGLFDFVRQFTGSLAATGYLKSIPQDHASAR